MDLNTILLTLVVALGVSNIWLATKAFRTAEPGTTNLTIRNFPKPIRVKVEEVAKRQGLTPRQWVFTVIVYALQADGGLTPGEALFYHSSPIDGGK